LKLRTIKDVHKALYRELIEWFRPPSRVAIAVRNALANAKTWRSNPKRGRRPRVKRLSMLLHPRAKLQDQRRLRGDHRRYNA